MLPPRDLDPKEHAGLRSSPGADFSRQVVLASFDESPASARVLVAQIREPTCQAIMTPGILEQIPDHELRQTAWGDNSDVVMAEDFGYDVGVCRHPTAA